MLLVIAHAVQMTERVRFRGIAAVRGIFAQIVDHRACRGERLRMTVQPEAGQFGHAKLLPEKALGVFVLENPLVQARLHSAATLEQRGFSGFKKLLRTWQQGFTRPQQL